MADAAGGPEAVVLPPFLVPGRARDLSLRGAGPLVLSWLAPEEGVNGNAEPVLGYDVEVGTQGAEVVAFHVDVSGALGGLQELSVVVVLPGHAPGAPVDARVRPRSGRGTGAWAEVIGCVPLVGEDEPNAEVPAPKLKSTVHPTSMRGHVSWARPSGLIDVDVIYQVTLWECECLHEGLGGRPKARVKQVLSELGGTKAPLLVRLTSSPQEEFAMAEGRTYVAAVSTLLPGRRRSPASATHLTLPRAPRHDAGAAAEGAEAPSPPANPEPTSPSGQSQTLQGNEYQDDFEQEGPEVKVTDSLLLLRELEQLRAQFSDAAMSVAAFEQAAPPRETEEAPPAELTLRVPPVEPTPPSALAEEVTNVAPEAAPLPVADAWSEDPGGARGLLDTSGAPPGQPVTRVPWAQVVEVGMRAVALEWGAAGDDDGPYPYLVSVRDGGDSGAEEPARVEFVHGEGGRFRRRHKVWGLRPGTRYEFELRWLGMGGRPSDSCIALAATTCAEPAGLATGAEEKGTMTDARWREKDEASDAGSDDAEVEAYLARRRAYDRLQLLGCMLLVVLHLSNVALELDEADRAFVAALAVVLPWALNAGICRVFHKMCQELSAAGGGATEFGLWLLNSRRLATSTWVISVVVTGGLGLFRHSDALGRSESERHARQDDRAVLESLRSKREAAELREEGARRLHALRRQEGPRERPGAAWAAPLEEPRASPRGTPQSAVPAAGAGLQAPPLARQSPDSATSAWGVAELPPGLGLRGPVAGAAQPGLGASVAAEAEWSPLRMPGGPWDDREAAIAAGRRLEASAAHAAPPSGGVPAAGALQGAVSEAPPAWQEPPAAWEALGGGPEHCLLCGQRSSRPDTAVLSCRWFRTFAIAGAVLYRDVPQVALTLYLWSTAEHGGPLADATRAANVFFTVLYVFVELLWLGDALTQLLDARRAHDPHKGVTAIAAESGPDWVEVSWAAPDRPGRGRKGEGVEEYWCSLRPLGDGDGHHAPHGAVQIAVVASGASDPESGRAAWTFRGLAPACAFEATVTPVRGGVPCGAGQRARACTSQAPVAEGGPLSSPKALRFLKVTRLDARSACLEWSGDAGPTALHSVALLAFHNGLAGGDGGQPRTELAEGCTHELRGLEPGTAYLAEVSPGPRGTPARRGLSSALSFVTPPADGDCRGSSARARALELRDRPAPPAGDEGRPAPAEEPGGRRDPAAGGPAAAPASGAAAPDTPHGRQAPVVKLYRAVTGIGIRREPDVGSDRTGADVTAGDVFEVTEEVKGNDGQRYLKLKNNGGWLFTLGLAGEWLGKPIVEAAQEQESTEVSAPTLHSAELEVAEVGEVH